MIALATADCRRYRAEIETIALDREGPWVSGPALDHLADCRRCREQAQSIALSAIALRRLAVEVERQVAALPDPGPADPMWLRLRARLQRRRTTWRWRVELGGLLAGSALVAALIGPTSITRNVGPIEEVGVLPGAAAHEAVLDARAESAWMSKSNRSRKELSTPTENATVRSYSLIWGPEGRRPPEVPPAPRRPVAK